jgi:rRNA-processing protein EBP2
MAKKSKLLAALDAHKGRNYELERQKGLQKKAEKRKNAQVAATSLEDEALFKDNVQGNGSGSQLEEDNEGWESEESEDVRTCSGGGEIAGERID